MAFDFGAALSSIGQIAPAMSEGAEIRRQRQADAADVAQRAQAAQDTHAQRLAQTAREQQLTAQEQQNAGRYIKISDKPIRGADGKYYILTLDPQNHVQRLPIGDYDPDAENKALAAAVGAEPGSDLYTAIMTGIKPTQDQYVLEKDDKGQYNFIQKPGRGALSSVNPDNLKPQTVSDKGALSASPAPAGPKVIPTGVKGTLPAGVQPKYQTHEFHWTDSQGREHSTPYTTYSGPVGQKPAGGTAPPSTSPTRTASSTTVRPNGLIGNDRIIGTGKLPAAAEKVVITTQPIIDQTDAMIANIDKLGLANNNTRGYLSMDYANYRLGKAAPAGTLANDIAGLSLSSVVDAASALQGTSRSVQALQKAMIHTPNPIIDSPQLLREKLVTINSRLKDMVREAKSAGQGGSQSPDAWEKTLVNPTTHQRIGLRAGKYYDLQTGEEVQ